MDQGKLVGKQTNTSVCGGTTLVKVVNFFPKWINIADSASSLYTKGTKDVTKLDSME